MQRIAKESVIVQLSLLLIALALFASTYSQSFTESDVAQSPMFFPRIILALWVTLNVIALIQTIRSETTMAPIESWVRIVVVLVATCLYTNLIGKEGFFLPSVVFALVSLPAFGIRHPLLVLAFSLAIPGALVLLFNHILGMPLPTSRFSHWF